MIHRTRFAALAAACLTLASLAPVVLADPGDDTRGRRDDPRWTDSQDRHDADSDSRWSDGPAYGGRRGGGALARRGNGARGMLAMLNLSAEQKDRIRAIRARHADRLRELGQQVKDARQELETRALRDDGRAQPAIDRIVDLQARLTRERLEMMVESGRVLTAEQRERLHAAHERMRERMQQRRDRGGDRDHGGNRDRDDR